MPDKRFVQEGGPMLAESPPEKSTLERLADVVADLALATAEAALASRQNSELLERLVDRTDKIERQVRGQTEAAAKALARMSARSAAARELVEQLRKAGPDSIAEDPSPREPSP